MKKRGRPTDNPKTNAFNVRLDEESNEILIEYIEKYGVSKAEVVRRGIKKLSEDLGGK